MMASTEKSSAELPPMMARTGPFEHTEQFRRRPHPQLQASEMGYANEEDTRMDATRARLSALVKRHENLKERLSRDSDKIIYERLRREFDAARDSHGEGMSYRNQNYNKFLRI